MIPFFLLPVLVFIVDLPWLMYNSTTSRKMIESIQKSELSVRLIPSIVVYIALAYLITLPKSTESAFLLGLSTYAVYDFTNYATLKNYSLEFAIMDSLWGGILFVILYTIINYFKNNK